MSDRRFPRTARLLASAEYKRVFQRGRRSSDGYFTILAATRGSGPARLGLAIAKKQARRAVDRNRLKRLIREVFRERRGLLAGLDLVVMARNTASRTDNATLRASLESLFAELASAGPDKR